MLNKVDIDLACILIEHEDNMILDRPFTMEALDFVIDELPNDKAPRSNGFLELNYKGFKKAGDKFMYTKRMEILF